jgi:uncharacterized protein (TIGR03790 family)
MNALPRSTILAVFFLLTGTLSLFAPPYLGTEPGSAVVVVYNSALPESKSVAEYYAMRRQVPPNQIFGFSLPVTESMTRAEFIQKLQMPLWQALQKANLIALGAIPNAPAPLPPMAPPRRIANSTFRYIALCYGVPTKVLRDTSLVERGTENVPEALRRNEGAVDADLACLPLIERGLIWTGPNVNPFYGVSNAMVLQPTNGIVMVTRLDGPSAAIAMGLVDKAMEAETNGLWGRAYFDARGITSGGYKTGDDWMRHSANIARSMGFETELDDLPATFAADHPMSHIALYAGWYDEHVSGPFTQARVEFMPGAFAYHLHSFSAQVLRSTTQHWVGPLLQKGATITMGCVDEPYLDGTPDIAMFLSRLVYYGFSFGEAAYAAQGSVSWQTTVIGDPLYRPFGKQPGLLQYELEQRGSQLLDLVQLRLLDLQQASGTASDKLVATLKASALTPTSAALTEKLGDLLLGQGNLAGARAAWEQALALNPSPQQAVRLRKRIASIAN